MAVGDGKKSGDKFLFIRNNLLAKFSKFFTFPLHILKFYDHIIWNKLANHSANKCIVLTANLFRFVNNSLCQWGLLDLHLSWYLYQEPDILELPPCDTIPSACLTLFCGGYCTPKRCSMESMLQISGINLANMWKSLEHVSFSMTTSATHGFPSEVLNGNVSYSEGITISHIWTNRELNNC